jgi:type I restriction enzyme, R subunit
MNKKSFTERDICSKFITPAVIKAGWDLDSQVREEVSFTKGRIIVRGKLVSRGQPKRADYILYYKPNIPIAVIEAKDNTHCLGDGMQQALGYAECLDIPFVFSSNGDAFLEHDRTVTKGIVEKEVSLESFPSPQTLWVRYCKGKGITAEQEEIVTLDNYIDTSGKTPRYFQQNAINRTIEAIARGQNRILLVMATGTGKTYTAFHIIWKLWKSGIKKRILFLVDRNILADQTRTNDFKPFGNAMTKITNRNVDKSYEIYLSLYQAFTGPEEAQKIYRQYSPEFFDLIVIDECHRGSAADDAAWREILTYFTKASQIGLTATPKETEYVSNINYFGEPVYSYSLKQGIEDGFLAPYKVVRIDIDRDLAGWRPEKGKLDKLGRPIPDRIYNQKDFDRNLILDQRTSLVAKKIMEFLRGTNLFDKTIVFCEDIDHAERMRCELVNHASEFVAENRKYIMRITGDNPEGKEELDNFILPESRYPVIVTTSKLMTTGVDAQTCKFIVIDQNIASVSIFKQIIGRGTRINEDYGKLFFTIMDFRKATELFADEGFDGPPIQIYEPGPTDPPIPPDPPGGEPVDPPVPPEPPGGGDDIGGILVDPPPPPPREPKYVVADVEVKIVAERVQYYDKDGKLVTESLREYTRKNVHAEFASLDAFLAKWSSAEKKRVIIEELEQNGIFLSALAEEVGKNIDPFDLICHVAYDKKPLTRRERAANVRKRNYFTKYEGDARRVLDALLDKYSDEGIETIEDIGIINVTPIKEIARPLEIFNAFGGKEKYLKAVSELERELYTAA